MAIWLRILIISLCLMVAIVTLVFNSSKSTPSCECFDNAVEYDLVYEHTSPWQKIEFFERHEDNTFALVLNDQIQVHSREYKTSHHIQCAIPIEKYKPKRILILGGGDLIAASICLKYDFVEEVTLVEIDSDVVEFAKTNTTFRKITNNASSDKRLTILIGDAIEFIKNTRNHYDFIIEDVEIDFTKQKKSTINKNTFLNLCLEKSSIYCGSIPDYDINPNSSIMKKATEKTKTFQRIKRKDMPKTFEDISYEFQNKVLKDRKVFVAAYDYGSIYGVEAYLLIE